MKTLGFGIIGCGVIAPWHAIGIQKAEGAELVAVCDIIPEKMKVFAEKWEVEKMFENYNDLVNDPDIDAVCICTPSGLHGEPTIAAARAGKHVLSEKPLEITKEKMDQMIEECRKAGVKLGGIFQRRAYPEFHKAREIIDSGKIGKLVLGDAYLKYYRSQAYYDSGGWRGTWALDGGGALMNQGVHGIDALLWMMGPVKRVISAKCDHLARNIEVEDTAVVMLEYENGAFGVIEGTTSIVPGYPSSIEIHGELGTLKLDDNKIVSLEILGEEKKEAEKEEAGTGAAAEPTAIGTFGHEQLVQDLVNAINEDRDPMIPGEKARQAVDLILAIYEANRTGKEVVLS